MEERSRPNKSWGWERLAFFVCIHVLSLVAEIAAIWIFLHTRDYLFASFLLVPIIFSGLFCSYTAWYTEMRRTGSRLFPLKDQTCVIRYLLILPMGFLQGVILWLAFEEHAERNADPVAETEMPTMAQPLTEPQRPSCRHKIAAPNKYHCKAVNGLFEGIASTMVLLYAFWTMGVEIGDPPKPITVLRFRGEGFLVGALGIICFVSTGLGLMELDFSTSSAIAKRMSSTAYQIIHCLFRTCEVTSRVCMFVAFMVLTRDSPKFRWWWGLLLGDFCLTAFFVSVFGGAETSVRGWFLRILCSVPCAFANIFAFIDAPDKCRAAKLVFRCLTCKHAAEQVFLPLSLYWGMGSLRLWTAVKEDWQLHWFMVTVALCASLLYWPLLAYISMKSFHSTRDIFSACHRGSVNGVQEAMKVQKAHAAMSFNVNQPSVDGLTPLMIAAAKGHSEVCQLLIRNGAQVEVRRRGDNRICRAFVTSSLWYRWTALHMAVWHRRSKVVKILVEAYERRHHAADSWVSSFQDSIGRTPLDLAAEMGQVELCGYLAWKVEKWKEKLQSSQSRLEQLSAEIRRAMVEWRPDPDMESASDGEPSTWQEVEVPIDDRNQWIAPGLCSYVASCCGGALGHALLVSPEKNQVASSESPVPVVFFGGRRQRVEFEELEPVGEHVLGKGAFGSVAMYEHKDTGEIYAVKTTKEKEGNQHWLRREFEIADRISLIPHPCLVQLFSVKYLPNKGEYRLVMELCSNGDLGNYLGKLRCWYGDSGGFKNYVPPTAAVAWIGQIFLGLEHMHRRMDTVLRDLKPENVVLSNRYVAKLTDFGLGRFGVDLARDYVVGTQGYWAPEIVLEEDFDFHADLFSLGVLTWVLFSGGLLKKNGRPLPPISERKSRVTFVDHAKDYRQLQKCLEDPESNCVLRLSDQQQDFVAKLIKKNPRDRLDHEDIRKHPLFDALGRKLPCYEDTWEVVQEWLDDLCQDYFSKCSWIFLVQ